MMNLTQLNEEDYKNLMNELCHTWDIRGHYWYPLAKCTRNDLIAFDAEYVQTQEKLEYLIGILKEHNVLSLYQFREDGIANIIEDINAFNFWNSDDYFWNNECFWFDESMEWIIYLSHEQTITFGGEWIISKLKDKWRDWDKNISWDTKNK